MTQITDLGRESAESSPVSKRKRQKLSKKLFEAIENGSSATILKTLSLLKAIPNEEDMKDIINARNQSGATPLWLYFARRAAKKSVVMELLSMGADPALKPKGNLSVLYYICSDWAPGFEDVLRKVLSRGADPDEPWEHPADSITQDLSLGKPPILWMALKGRLNPEIIRIFADAGANMRIADEDGYTALSPELFLRDWFYLDMPPGSTWRKNNFETMKRSAKELMALGVHLYGDDNSGKGFSRLESALYNRLESAFYNNPQRVVEHLPVLIAAGGHEQLRDYFRDALAAGVFSGLTPRHGGRSGKKDIEVQVSLLALMALGFIYPETCESLQGIWESVPRNRALNTFLENLKDAENEDMETFAPLFVNIMAIQGGQRGTLKIGEENLEVLVQLLSVAADNSPEAVVQFISRKLKGQMESWEAVPGMEELTAKLGAFLRDRAHQQDGASLNLPLDLSF